MQVFTFSSGMPRRKMRRRLNRFKLGTVLILSIYGAARAQIPPPPAPLPSGPAAVLQQPAEISFEGSVPAGQASSTPLELSLRDAIQRGLKYNLGILVNQGAVNAVKAQRIRTLSALLPNIYAG